MPPTTKAGRCWARAVASASAASASQRPTDGCFLRRQHAVEQVHNGHGLVLGRPGRERRQIVEKLLAVGVDDHAAHTQCQGLRECRLAACGTAADDDQQLVHAARSTPGFTADRTGPTLHRRNLTRERQPRSVWPPTEPVPDENRPNMSALSTTPQVLIVGAGPAGLFAACELARHGVSARLVDRMTDPHHEARATALQPAVLELLARAGVVERFLATGVPVRGVRMFGPGLKQVAVGSFAGIGSTYEHQCSLPQWMTEGILTAHLEQLGGRVERGTEVAAIEDSDDCRPCLASPRRRLGWKISACPICWVPAARMAQPAQPCMPPWTGRLISGHFVVADVRVDLPGEPEEARVCVGPTGLVLLAPLPDQRWIMFVTLDEDQAAPLGMHPTRPRSQRWWIGAWAHARESTTCSGAPRSPCTGASRQGWQKDGASCWATPRISRARWAARA